MPTYHRETRVEAPLEDVWAFHSHVSGLEALTPGFMNLSVERVVGPDGEENPEVLETGARIEMAMRPFGVGPTQRWTSVIDERVEDADAPYFRDTMEGGPFPKWVHTHAFYREGDATVVSDTVEYELPPPLNRTGPFSKLGFEPMFVHRHRTTKKLLED
ncbi:SRPBCC family protein [Natronomonas sp. EA1]|uniref:SRPBCC family protein n=1 Tax=Natronomonas sp. EA1 TaxID=3421655 RepID=UPI003EBA5D98